MLGSQTAPETAQGLAEANEIQHGQLAMRARANRRSALKLSGTSGKPAPNCGLTSEMEAPFCPPEHPVSGSKNKEQK